MNRLKQFPIPSLLAAITAYTRAVREQEDLVRKLEQMHLGWRKNLLAIQEKFDASKAMRVR